LRTNSRIDIAIACGSDCVHLRSRASCEISPGDARAIVDQAGITHPIIGISCHNLEDVLLAESEGADFAVFGPVFGKKGSATANGLEALRQACRRKPALMPVFALGGITVANARS